MYAESGGRSDATGHNTNGSVDRGCFQINSVHLWRVNNDIQALYKPKTNTIIALQIYKEQGWKPWVTARKLGLVK